MSMTGDPNFNQGTGDGGVGTQIPPGSTLNINIPPPPPPDPKETFTREEVERLLAERDQRIGKAREEEKTKLYPQIATLTDELAILKKEREDRLAAEEAAKAQAEEEARKKKEEEMTALQRIEAQQNEWTQRFSDLEAERDRERALREKEQQFAQLAEYRHRRIQEEGEAIAPYLVEYVNGSTEEQIEKSIERVKESSAKMISDVQEWQQGQRRGAAPSPTGAPPIDMLGQTGTTRTISSEEIAGMSMEEYAAMRGALQGAASRQVAERGLYG